MNALNNGVSRSLSGGKYQVNHVLVQWDTSALPDDATVTSARLTIWPSNVTNTDARNFQGEWFNWGATCGESDWTAAGGLDSFNVENSTLKTNDFNNIALNTVQNERRATHWDQSSGVR
jgi:hypothetical protein